MNVRMISHESPIADDRGSNAPGLVCLANEERFSAAHFSEPLTAYATGWRDPNDIQATLDAMFPAVAVGRRFEFKKGTNNQYFLSEADDVRAINAPFKRVEYAGSTSTDRTLNKGLTIRIDRDDMMPGDEERKTALLLDRINRNDLRRGVALIVAAATNSNKTWDTTAGKDPDQDVIADLITGGDARGMESNTVVYGQTAWQKRALAHRAQSSAGGFSSAALMPDALAQLLGVDRVVISRERYQSSSSAKSKIVGAYVLMYQAQTSLDKDDPSNVKRFYTPTDAGRVRVFREEVGPKFIDITVEHYSNIVLPSTLGIRMFTVS